jgi:hypothetical protein
MVGLESENTWRESHSWISITLTSRETEIPESKINNSSDSFQCLAQDIEQEPFWVSRSEMKAHTPARHSVWTDYDVRDTQILYKSSWLRVFVFPPYLQEVGQMENSSWIISTSTSSIDLQRIMFSHLEGEFPVRRLRNPAILRRRSRFWRLDLQLWKESPITHRLDDCQFPQRTIVFRKIARHIRLCSWYRSPFESLSNNV